MTGAIGRAVSAMPDADVDGLTTKVLSPRVPGADAAAAKAAFEATAVNASILSSFYECH